MSDTAKLVIHKVFTYRGVRELWDNAHHLDTAPQSAADWVAIANAVGNLELGFLPADVCFVGATGYLPGESVADWHVEHADHTYPGSFVPGGAEYPTPGDVAGWVRWTTTQMSSRGKPIYLRSYYHGMYSWGDKDQIASNMVTPMQAFATAFTNGISANGRTYRRAGPRGAVAQAGSVGQYLTTRTLKARGRRKKTTVHLLAPGLQIPPGDYTIN